MNATVLISPRFCEDQNIPGCVSKANNVSVDLIFKTFGFLFEIYGNLTITNVNLRGNDIILNSSCVKSCYPDETAFCCSQSLMSLNFTDDPCGLNSRTIQLNDISALTYIRGLFQLRMIYNSTLPSIVNITIPTLNLVNVQINMFYSMDANLGWLALIVFTTLGYDINIFNVNITSNFFPYGLVYFSTLETDPYYKSLPSAQRSNLYSTYCSSDVFLNNFIIQGLTLSDYNTYSAKIANNYAGKIANAIINFFTNYNPNQNYSLSDFQLINLTVISNPDSVFYFENTLLTSQSNFLFNNLVVSNSTFGIMLKMKRNSIYFNDFRTNSIVVYQVSSLFYIENNAAIYFNNSNFTNIHFQVPDGDFSTLIYITDSFVSIQNSIFYGNTQGMVFIINGVLNVYNCSLTNLYFDSISLFKISSSNSSLNLIEAINITCDYTEIFYTLQQKDNLFLNLSNLVFKDLLITLTSYYISSFIVDYSIGNPNFLIQNFSLFNLTHLEKYFVFAFLNGNKYNVISMINATFPATNTFSLLIIYQALFYQITFEEIHIKGLSRLNYYFIGISNYENLLEGSFVLFKNTLFYDMHSFVPYEIVFMSGIAEVFFQNFTSVQVSGGLQNRVNLPHVFLIQNFYHMLISNVSFINNTIYFGGMMLYGITSYNVSLENSYFIGTLTNDSMTRAVIVSDVAQVTIKNCYFENLASPSGPSFLEYAGIVGIQLAFGKLNSYNATLINNVFKFCIGVQDAIVTNLKLMNVNFYNNSFEDILSYYGIFSSKSISFLTLQKGFARNIQSNQNGGVIYSKKTNHISISEGNFSNLSSQSGGVIYSESSSEILMSNVFVNNSTSNLDGGSFYFLSSLKISIENVTILNSFSLNGNGGILFQNLGDLMINELHAKNSRSSEYGGAIMVSSNFKSIFQINNSSFFNCSQNSAGSFYIKNIKNLTILNTIIGSSKGTKTICIEDIAKENYDKNNLNYPRVFIQNLSCLNNTGKYNCLYFSSTDLLSIRDLFIYQSTGSSLYIESPLNMSFSIYLNNITISKCNWLISSGDLITMTLFDALITLHQSNFEISGLKIFENYNEGNLMNLFSVQVEINSSSLNGFYTKGNMLYYFINVQSSNLDINSLQMNSSVISNGILNVLSSNVNLNGFLISSLTMSGPLPIYIYNSQMILNNSSFYNCASSDPILNVINSNLRIINGLFIEPNQTLSSGYSSETSSILLFQNIEADPSYDLEILNCSFVHFDKNAIVLTNALNFTLNFSSFVSAFVQIASEQQFSRAIYLDNIRQTSIFSSNFSSFRAGKGGALSFIESAALQYANNLVTISDCIFQRNKGNMGAAIYLHGLFHVKLYRSQFSNNSAIETTNDKDSGKGGCLLSQSEYFMNASLDVANCSFQENWADILGSCLLVKNGGPSTIYEDNKYANNGDGMNFSDSVASLPMHYYILGEKFSPNMNLSFNTNLVSNKEKTNKIISTYGIKEIVVASGQNFNFSILLTDYYNQTLLPENEALGTLKCLMASKNSTETKEITIDRSSAIAVKGIIFFSNVNMVYNFLSPNTSISCIVTLQYDDSIFVTSILEQDQPNLISRTIEISIPVQIRNCTKGEILMADHSCRFCQESTYSIKDPMLSNATLECKNCPSNAICPGGDYIYPLQGNWRHSDNSSLILTCPTEEACLGYDMNMLSDISDEEKLSGRCHPN